MRSLAVKNIATHTRTSLQETNEAEMSNGQEKPNAVKQLETTSDEEHTGAASDDTVSKENSKQQSAEAVGDNQEAEAVFDTDVPPTAQMSGPVLRQATRADAAAIATCNVSVLPENYPREFYEQFFSVPSHCALVVEMPNGEIAGYVMLLMHQNSRNEVYAHIYSLGVYPQYRRRNFATALLNVAERQLQTRFPETRYVSLHVRKSNRIAQAVYTKLDFMRAKVIKRYYTNGKKEDALLYKKRLAAPPPPTQPRFQQQQQEEQQQQPAQTTQKAQSGDTEQESVPDALSATEQSDAQL